MMKSNQKVFQKSKGVARPAPWTLGVGLVGTGHRGKGVGTRLWLLGPMTQQHQGAPRAVGQWVPSVAEQLQSLPISLLLTFRLAGWQKTRNGCEERRPHMQNKTLEG